MTDVVTRLRALRGPWIGDGINPPINAYELADQIDELREELLHAAASLVGAASAYKRYARRHSSVTPKAVTDAMFTTRANDFEKAADRAAEAYAKAKGT